MNAKTAVRPSSDEQKLLQIVRRLPPERMFEVINFAEFLESRMTKIEEDDSLYEGETEEEIAADNALWDALFASEESQRLLEKMADEALAAIEAGQARPMIFTEDGEIAPG